MGKDDGTYVGGNGVVLVLEGRWHGSGESGHYTVRNAQ